MTISSLQISISLLSADFAHLGDELRAMDQAAADLIHLDVMDGGFVPNLTFGPPVIKALRPYTDKPFDAHLMVNDPEHLFPAFADVGCQSMTIHPDAVFDPLDNLRTIRSLGMRAGLAFNPDAPLDALYDCVHDVDLVLVMTVQAGFGGQAFMPLYDRIHHIRDVLNGADKNVQLMVDGGVSPAHIPALRDAGVDVVVVGTAAFRGGPSHYAQNILNLRGGADAA